MRTIIQSVLYTVCCLYLFTACYEDKGNYSYKEIPEITAENMPASITVIQKTDPIIIEPIFKSSTGEVIDANNTNYEFGCKLYIQAGSLNNNSRFIDINEAKNINVNYVPDVDPGDYLCWYTLTDKRTGVTTNYEIPVKVTSVTYEGWMVLCDVGNENKVRLDLVSVLGPERKEIVHDMLGKNAPDLKNARSIYYDAWPNYAKGDFLGIVTQDGTYALDANNLQTTDLDNIILGDFIITPENEQVVAFDVLPFTGHLAITDKGNLYTKVTWKAGTAFEVPVNTSVVDGNPEYELAPFMGVPKLRPYNYDNVILLYDKTNKRFLKWDQNVNEGYVCVELNDPANALFSFQTGCNIVDMISTFFSGGTVYSIMENDAKERFIYGINISGGSFDQTYYEKMSIDGFDKATEFAFHSQYPYMFYNGAENKVYCYQLISHSLNQPLTLDGEEITLLKFNLFQRASTDLSDSSDEFMEQQHYLIVGSYKKNATDDNGGILRFYKFDQSNQTLTLVSEYTGFGKIRDVVYRER